MPDEVTTGELSRRFDSLERSLDRRFAEIQRSIYNIEFVHKDVYVADVGAIQKRLDELEEGRKVWPRIIVASALLPILVAIILPLLLR